MIEQAIQRLTNLVYEVGYPGLFIASFLENLIPPIPSEIIMPLGGYLAGIGKLDLFTVIIVCSLGSTFGNIPFYFLGRLLSQQKMIRLTEKYGKFMFISAESVKSIYYSFKKHDKKIVLIGRFVPGARGLIGIPAGSAKMDFFQFTLYTFIGTTIWSVFLVSMGFVTGEKIDMLRNYFHTNNIGPIVLGVVIVIAFIIAAVITKRTYHKRRSRQQKNS